MHDDRAVEPRAASISQISPAGAGYGEAYRAELDETEIIKQHVPTVKRMATHLKGRLPEAVQLDDLIQAGLIAALRIVRQAECGHVGEAMLRRSIMNAMIDEARREAWAPTRAMRQAKAAVGAMRAIRLRTGRDGSDEEVAAELGIALSRYHQVLVEVAGIRLFRLDVFDEGSEPALQVADNQEELLHQSRVAAALAAAIRSLPKRERLVVSLYYEHELNMEEVGEILGLNKSTICRSHGRALLMLRTALGEPKPTACSPVQTAGN